MTTPMEFLPPTTILSEAWVEELWSALETRGEVVAAYHVMTRHTEPPVALQEELHIELLDPQHEGAAPVELFREFASLLPSMGDLGFTVSPKTILPQVREAGRVLWKRES